MTNILITSAGQRVSLIDAFKHELKQSFPESKVFTTDLNPILAPACHISDNYFKVPPATDINYCETILDICVKNNIKMVIPTIDTELLILSQNRQKFIDKEISLVISDFDFIQICRDKRRTNALFLEHNINIPEQFDSQKSYDFRYPVFVKPYNGSLSKGIFILNSEKELKQEYLNNPELMFMSYISPEDYKEYTIDCYFDKKSNLKSIVPRERIFVRAGEINKGVTRKNSIVTELGEKISTLRGARGCITIQVFYNERTQEILGIEINPRFGGGYPLSYQAGANYPKWLILEYLRNEEIAFYDDWQNNLLMLRYEKEVIVENYVE